MDEASYVGTFADALTDADLATLRAIGRQAGVRGGTSLLVGGFATDRVLLIDSGFMKLTCVTDEGREVLLGIAGPGELVGAGSALDGRPPAATATAVHTVQATMVPAGCFRRFVHEHPGAMKHLLLWMSRQLWEARHERVALVAERIHSRVARRLVQLADRAGQPYDGGLWIAVPLSQAELASWVGASRGAVSQALRGLERRGLIAMHRRHITIRDRRGLRQLLARSEPVNEHAGRLVPDVPSTMG